VTGTLRDVVTPRRLVTAAVIALAGLVIVVGLQATRTPNQTDSCPVASTPIQQLIPCPGDSVLNQAKVGVDMEQGWLVDLYVDGTPIPRDQVQVEGSLYLFQPGPDTDVGTLHAGAHTARVVYYRQLAEEASGQSYAWRFTTH
jgi:hypothetical protein